MERVTDFELTNEFIKELEKAINDRDDSFILSAFDNVNPADITETLHQFNTEDSKYVVSLLGFEIGAEIIKGLEEDIKLKFLREFEISEIVEYVDQMDSDDAVDILQQLPVKSREEIIAEISNQEKVNYIVELLRYEEDCAGGLMAKELIKANVNWTVDECINEIRRQAENVQKIFSVYVVNDEDKLLGRVSLKRIILSSDHTKIKDIYEEDVESVITYSSEEEVASVMQKYDLESVPVLNIHNKLVGRITIDDVVDVITEQAEEERQLMAGISEDVEEDDSIWMLSRARLPWLIIGLFGGILGAKLIGIFETDLVQITAIAFFIPLVMATGGNVGIQSATLTVQSLASPSLLEVSLSQKMFKVLWVALINGLVLGALVFGAIYLINLDIKLAIVVSVALFNVILLASFTGTIVPLLLDRIKINPALASGPFITTTIDLLGLAVYFLIAHYLYNL